MQHVYPFVICWNLLQKIENATNILYCSRKKYVQSIHDRLANAMGGIDAAQQRRRLQMLFDSDSDSDADFSGFPAPESDNE